MSKKITFKELQDFVANIDYIDEESYPINFKVDGNSFSCGICDEIYSHGESLDYNREGQYLLNSNGDCLDLQDPDMMIYDEIGNMLKEKCNITDTSTIILLKGSFNGDSLEYIDEDECIDNTYFEEHRKMIES